MKPYQQHFIQMAIAADALKFGEFTLKSGRVSPYFFHINALLTNEYFADLGRIYAAAIISSGVEFDLVFGPAYKGIPLCCSTTIALNTEFMHNASLCFNRKQAKDHGEGGQIVGADVRGKKVLIVDDVITAGTAIHESMAILMPNKVSLAGVMVAVNRLERGQGANSADSEIEQKYHTKVHSIVTIADIIEYLQHEKGENLLSEKIRAYQKQYGLAC